MNAGFAVLRLPRHLGLTLPSIAWHGWRRALRVFSPDSHVPERATRSHSPGTDVFPGLRVNLQSGEEDVGQGRCGLVS